MIASLLLVPTALFTIQAGEPEVAVVVRNPAGAARTDVPVRGGVPFALGALKECSGAALVDGQGRGVPCAARTIARWHDGSVKWLMVDAQVSVPAAGEAALRLRPNVAPNAGRKLNLVQDARTITIDTGPARFRFAKDSLAPPVVWTDADGDGTLDQQPAGDGGEVFAEFESSLGPPEEENWLRDAAGGARVRCVPGDCVAEIETANELHAVVRQSGWLVAPDGRKPLQMIIRAHVYAGRPELKLAVTFVFCGNPKQDFLRALGVRFQRRAAGQATWALGGQTRHGGRLAGEAVSLTELGPDKFRHLVPYTIDRTVHYTVDSGMQKLGEGKEAAGWGRVSDQAGALHLAVGNFWRMHPKELRLEPGAATCYLWPERGGKVLDLRRRSDVVDNAYHYDLSLWPYGGEGVAVTHDLLVRYGPAAEDLGDELTAALDQPLRLFCPPARYAETLVFGPLAPADRERFPRVEAVQDVGLAWIRQNQRAFHWDGLIDYGDTCFHGLGTPTHAREVEPDSWGARGYVGWLNNDGTLTHSLYLRAVRTGDEATFRTAEAMARHVMDVDTCHYCAEEPRQVGGGHRHDQQHWGNGVRGYGTATHGAIDTYCLTGDERALEVAKEYAQYHLDGEPSENEDRIGGLIRLWEITGEPVLKEKADELVAAELAVPAGDAWPFVTKQHFRFVSNTSASLLAYLYAAPPADAEKLWSAVVRSVDGRADAFLSSWDDAGYLMLTLSALAWQRTREPRHADIVQALVQRQGIPRTAAVPVDWPAALEVMPFEELRRVAGQWSVNNIYMLGIHQLCSLPYALAALGEAGRSEAELWAFQRIANLPEAFEEVIEPKAISKEIGFCYTVGLRHGSPSDVGGGRSYLVLLEDGRELGPAHSAHEEIRKLGQGRYSHWGARSVYFSASDNSDPRTNGRRYTVVFSPPAE